MAVNLLMMKLLILHVTDTQVIIQVTNLGIIDLGTVDLGKTVFKGKIIAIPGGIAS